MMQQANSKLYLPVPKRKKRNNYCMN
uniref:Uncharacterized protein n=1 Tax=Arundo donax TaxID=35708 RepID=A0A0A9FHA3_ARUDO